MAVNNINESEQKASIIESRLNEVSIEDLRLLIKEFLGDYKELIKMLGVDELTGLYNRHILHQVRSFSGAVMIDIDDFKSINDTFGHGIGDKVLKDVARILKLNTRISDYVIRMGGDEYLIIFSDCPEEIIKLRIEKIQQTVKETIVLPNMPVSLSVGIAMRKENEKLEDTIERADKALYVSKNNGKNQITCYCKKLTRNE